ncbi:MAG: hypothetical protein JWM76_4235 [Pseudonocardiales bacterium]|nr:hypothetical protein [Pseudonocardiales bacterium]
MTDSDMENRLETDGQNWRATAAAAPSLDDALDRMDTPAPRRRDPKVWLLAAASIVIVVGVALIPVFIRNGSTSPAAAPVAAPSAPLACPATIDNSSPPTVPDLPAGVDGRSRLVPTQTPDRVVICAYDHPADASTAPRPVTGSKILGGDLGGLAKELSAIPAQMSDQRACTLIGNLTVTDFLVGLNYPTGTVWVSTSTDANRCIDSSNGVFTTSTYLGARVSQWFAAGSWSK